MSKLNISDLTNIDVKKMVKEDPRFKQLYEQLDGGQQDFVEEFIEDLKSIFMPSVASFGEAMNEMTDEQRKEFQEKLKSLDN
jgi:predicted HicB family RNase H-like nuclease